MKCPYCGREMDDGYIYSGKTDIVWSPKDEKPNMLINHPRESQILLGKMNFIKGIKIKVKRCSNCKIQIINENDLEVTK